MSNRAQMLIMLAALVAVVSPAVQPVFAERDNNKRQLAVVVPVAPGTASVTKPPPAVPVKAKPAEMDPVRIPDLKVTPEMQKAFSDSAKTAGDLGRVVFHKATDVASWMSAVWKKIDTTPLVSPAGGPYSSQANVGPMRPLEEWGSKRGMYFTNERRIKTVVDR
jgi:hypothetical protein